MIKFEELNRYGSEILGCDYIVGKVGEKFIYIWSMYEVDDEIDENMVNEPEAMHGALIGTADEIIWELENCVGSFRWIGDEAQAAEATEIVEELTAAVREVIETEKATRP